MYYVYILQLKNEGDFYVGYTSNLKKRIFYHTNNMSTGTKFKDAKLRYFERIKNKNEAELREKKLKTYKKSWIINLILNFEEEINLLK